MTPDISLMALLHMLANLVADRLADRLPKQTHHVHPDALVDGVRMAKLLGDISPQSLDRLRKAGTVPAVCIGRLVRYRPESVIAALEQASAGDGIDA